MQTDDTACGERLRPTNPKARGSNPLGRTPTTSHEHSGFRDGGTPERNGAWCPGTPVGQTVPQREHAQCNAMRRVVTAGRISWRLAPGGRDAIFLEFVRLRAKAGGLPEFVCAFLGRTVRTDAGCLNWVYLKRNHRGDRGRGVLRFDANGQRHEIAAHRASWLLFAGPIEPRELAVRHLCHNLYCVNWLHLEPGTTAENRRDCRHKPDLAPRLRPLPEWRNTLSTLPAGGGK